MAVMIETRDLTYTYPAPEGETNPPALRDVSVQVEKGSFTVVLGHNGSGKSTFAKHLNAVLLPCGGAVYVDGMDTRDEKLLLEIRRRTGMVFQNPDNQIVANVVEEDVAFGPENLGVPTAEIRRRVDDALAAVGMEQFASHAPHLLSGGQKQRIAIAGILAMEPECIVLDEATAMLDPAGRREVIDTVLRLNREQGITVVLITHHMVEAERADRVIVMNDGEVAMDGMPRQVFSQVERLHELGLAAPDTVELLYRLGHNGSGKSTFAKHLNAVLLPCGGAVYVDGMDTRDEKLLLEIRRRTGMVFQNPDNQIVANVVEEDVAFGPENLGVPTAEIRRRVDDALAAVGMEQFASHAPHLLSGGQKQRIAIAGILAMEPECIVLDEATAMLDPAGRREVIDTVLRLNREQGITVVLITHHMVEAERADRVIVMNDGEVAMDGMPRQVFSQVERLHELGLAAPDTVELLYRLRRDGIDVPLDRLTVDECADTICRAFGEAEGK